MSTIQPFTKDAYMMLIREKRRQFVHELYPEQLPIIFEELHQNAMQGKNCHHEVTFKVESQYNIDCIQMYLLQYFQDLGYQPIVEPRKPESNSSNVTLTLT